MLVYFILCRMIAKNGTEGEKMEKSMKKQPGVSHAKNDTAKKPATKTKKHPNDTKTTKK